MASTPATRVDLDSERRAAAGYRRKKVQLAVEGYRGLVVLWIVKGVFVLVKSRRGRKLVVAAGLGIVDLAQSDEARKLYAAARTKIVDPAVRQTARRA